MTDTAPLSDTDAIARMTAGDLYRPGHPALSAARRRAQEIMRAYNTTIVGDASRGPLLQALLGSLGADVAIRAPLHVDYGFNIHLGSDVFMNFGCVLLDVCPIHIGDNVQIGPNVQIIAADHPKDPALRDQGLEGGRPVTIGRNVWIGGAAMILPGVRVGEDAVIGAGAIVTRDVAPGATVVGNPARPLPGRT